MAAELDQQRLQRLMDVGRALMSEPDLDLVLDRLLETALEITGARHAAVGVLDERRRELERFITRGLSREQEKAIGARPRGRGVLGLLIDDARPLRLSEVSAHPKSYGFPAGHPTMHSFLGVPVTVRGEAWGNLYLTDKDLGEFTAADEQAVIILADWAAIAINNARLHRSAQTRRLELERAVRGFEATQMIAVAVGAETDLQRILQLIVKRGRAVVNARSVLILLEEGDDLVVAAGAGQTESASSVRIPIADSTSGEVMSRGRSERIADVHAGLRVPPDRLGVRDAHSALLVPLTYRGRTLGVLAAFDRAGAQTFSEEDEQVLRSFAASAATAVATAQNVQADRLRHSLNAAEAERRRWARELHDETLQALGGLRVLLGGALRAADPEQPATHALRQAAEQIEHEIDNLRAIITELRPAALDELGLEPAVEALINRHRAVHGLEIASEVDLRDGNGPGRLLDPELESTVYRFVQEALNNVAKHARAEHAWVTVIRGDERVEARVTDDGVGFDPTHATSGFGLTGMRERLVLAGGQLTVDSHDGKTSLSATLPVRLAPRPVLTGPSRVLPPGGEQVLPPGSGT